jgi:hypothetical protein
MADDDGCVAYPAMTLVCRLMSDAEAEQLNGSL